MCDAAMQWSSWHDPTCLDQIQQSLMVPAEFKIDSKLRYSPIGVLAYSGSLLFDSKVMIRLIE